MDNIPANYDYDGNYTGRGLDHTVKELTGEDIEDILGSGGDEY